MMNERSGREVRDLMLTSDFFLPTPFCLLALLLPPLPLGAPMSQPSLSSKPITWRSTCRRRLPPLLQTYVSDGP